MSKLAGMYAWKAWWKSPRYFAMDLPAILGIRTVADQEAIILASKILKEKP